MNFLYGGGGSKAPSSDGHQPIQLPRTRVKLQPRRLRCTGGAPPEPELPERQVRTHIFMDLVANGPREAAPRRASPGLMDKLRPSSARKESWRRQQRSDEQAAAAAGAADPERPPAPRQGAAEELVSLDQLDQDCFIVPFDMVDRFLPAGHKLPATPPAQGQRLSMRETHNPGLGVVIHLLGHLLPVAPSALDPAPPRHVQLGACATLLRQAVQMGGTRDAMLLSNLERTEEFPFLLYYTVDKQRRSAPETYKAIVRAMQATFSRLESTYVADHTIKLFDEVATIARPPLSDQRRPTSDQTGYIISIFRVMEGDDRRNFERDWLSWTGARLLYRNIPACAGLRRMVLHKSCSGGDIYYVLTCECSALMANVVASVRALPALRARLVGYTGIFKPMVVS